MNIGRYIYMGKTADRYPQRPNVIEGFQFPNTTRYSNGSTKTYNGPGLSLIVILVTALRLTICTKTVVSC